MKVLITGVSGFLGKHLFNKMRLKFSVVGTSRNLLDKDIRPLILMNISSGSNWIQALSGVTCVVHCAGIAHISNYSNDMLESLHETNYLSTLNLAEQAASAGVKRFVYISSIGVNGLISDEPFKYSDIPKPQDPYAVSKREAEIGLKEVSEKTGMDIVIIRPPLVYGFNAPGNFGRLINLAIKNLPLPLGAINNKRSLVFIDNLIDLIVVCVDHPKAANQTFLVSDDHDVSTSDLLKSMIVAAGKKPRLFHVPVKVLSYFASLLGKRSVIDRMAFNLQVDINHTKDILGWEPPVSFEEGIRRCFK